MAENNGPIAEEKKSINEILTEKIDELNKVITHLSEARKIIDKLSRGGFNSPDWIR